MTCQGRDFARHRPIHLDFTEAEIARRDMSNRMFGFVLGVVCTVVVAALVSVGF